MAAPDVHQVVVVPAAPEQVMHQLVSVSGADKYSPVGQTPYSLRLHRKVFQTWTIVLAALLPIPFALLLLIRKDQVVDIGLQPVPDGTQVTIVGQGSQPLMSALHYALSGRQATAAGLPSGMPLPPYGAQPPPQALPPGQPAPPPGPPQPPAPPPQQEPDWLPPPSGPVAPPSDWAPPVPPGTSAPPPPPPAEPR